MFSAINLRMLYALLVCFFPNGWMLGFGPARLGWPRPRVKFLLLGYQTWSWVFKSEVSLPLHWVPQTWYCALSHSLMPMTRSWPYLIMGPSIISHPVLPGSCLIFSLLLVIFVLQHPQLPTVEAYQLLLCPFDHMALLCQCLPCSWPLLCTPPNHPQLCKGKFNLHAYTERNIRKERKKDSCPKTWYKSLHMTPFYCLYFINGWNTANMRIHWHAHP